MKRFHVHVGVTDLQQSIAFYNGLFGQDPSLIKPDYAKWMLDDPRINFAISVKDGAVKGVEHLGIQVEDQAELSQVYAAMKHAGRPVLEEGATTCCYAQSEKSWIADPEGVAWEVFLTSGEATVYGSGPAIEEIAAHSAGGAACCVPKSVNEQPALATGGCC
jgi:catechol 2,3-dioxygenase-like lactoylglutathione lyase family enzyme